MTILDLDPQTFYDAGDKCNEAANFLGLIISSSVTGLHDGDSMAGSDESGKEWARSYDEQAQLVVDSILAAQSALGNYCGILYQAGANHASANWNSDINNGEPESPPTPPLFFPVCYAPLPSSKGGSGIGLVDDTLGLAAEVGIPIPDADTSKLESVGRTWKNISDGSSLNDALTSLRSAISLYDSTESPDIEFIVDDLDELIFTIEAIQGACLELSASCGEYKTNIDEVRTQITDVLEDLAIELAATALISVAASFVSFGISVAAGAAKSAHSVSKFGRIIARVISTWRAAKKNIVRSETINRF